MLCKNINNYAILYIYYNINIISNTIEKYNFVF